MLSGEDLSHPIVAAPLVGGGLVSASTPTVHAPTVAQAVTVNNNAAVTGKTAAISVLGSDSCRGVRSALHVVGHRAARRRQRHFRSQRHQRGQEHRGHFQ